MIKQLTHQFRALLNFFVLFQFSFFSLAVLAAGSDQAQQLDMMFLGKFVCIFVLESRFEELAQCAEQTFHAHLAVEMRTWIQLALRGENTFTLA